MADTIVIETPVATVLEVSGKQGPQGPAGATGATGATGPQGPAGTGIETLTTAGDLLYRDNSAAARLPIGTSGQVLKVSSGGLPEWGAAAASGVTSVTGTAPIASSGGNTPAISISEATTSAAGSMSAADKLKLDGIAAGAEVNVNADWNASSGDAQILNKPTLGGAAALNVGTTTGTVAAGDDARLSDSRTPTAHAASHAAGTKAQFSGVIAGTGDNYLILADNIGTAGNSITLTFNGTDDIATVLSAWNSANTSNQAAVISGDDSLVPNNATTITLSGGTAAGSDPAFDQNLNTSNSPTFNKLTLTPSTTDSSFKLGTLELQSYALNNAWIGDNVYLDGANFKRRNIGAATLFYFQGNEGQFRCDESDDAGTSVTNDPSFKVGAGGKFSAGANVSNIGDFETGMLYSDGDNIGFSDKTDVDKKAKLDLSGITSGETRTLEIPDASGTLMLVGDAPASHTHGNITNGGLVGTTSGLPLKTGTGGIVEAGAFGTSAGQFAEGNHAHGNLTSTGAIGSTSGLPLVTTTAGTITTLALGSAGQVLKVNSGGTAVEFGAGFDAASPPAIGNTTPNTGAFTSLSTAPAANTSALTSTGYSLTGSNAQSLIELAGTWNTTGTPSAIKLNVTDTASNASSLLLQLQTSATNRLTVLKNGQINAGTLTVSTGATTPTSNGTWIARDSSNNGLSNNSGGALGCSLWSAGSVVALFNQNAFALNNNNFLSWSSSPTANDGATRLYRDAADHVIGQRNGTNSQEARIYATYTSGTNYQRMTVKSVKQTLSALSGASATTTGTFIPDGAVVVGVTTRVATALTGATGYTIGDGTDVDRWGDITGTAIGTTSDNRDWAAGTIECFTAGGNITLTAKTSNFTAGAVEICVFYLAGEAD